MVTSTKMFMWSYLAFNNVLKMLAQKRDLYIVHGMFFLDVHPMFLKVTTLECLENI